MPVLTINGTEVEVDRGTTLLKAAAVAGYEVPHFCYHPALSSPANCRMCLVEVEGAPKLMPGCYNQVNDGMIVHTESDRVKRARKAVLEFILVNHPVDCPICDKAGECKLQDYYFAYDAQESRMRAEKQHKVKVYPIGPRVVYDGERCILCTRCIRFCEEITGTGELTLADRGDKAEVRTFPGQDLDNDYSLCTVDVCPVGALTSRDFRFKRRVWLLTSTDSVCTGCEMGCNIHLDHFRNTTERYRPRYNPAVNDYWMCDDGRLSYKALNEGRLEHPMLNGAQATWHTIAGAAASKLAAVIEKNGASSVGFVISPQATSEDLFLAKMFAETAIGEGVRLFINGNDPGSSDELLIRADKNPNRAGARLVFGGLDGVGDASALADALEAGELEAVYMMGTELGAARGRVEAGLDDVGLFVLQAAHQGGVLLDAAHVALPAATHAEKRGTFVNCDAVVQTVDQAYPPNADALPDWQIFMKVAGAMGHKLPFTFLRQIQDRMFEASEAPEPEETATEEAPAPAE